MTDHVPINPCTIPQFTGDLDALEKNKAAIDTAAGTFRDAGSNVDSEFQGLSAFYSAPEAEKLFATTKPVKTDSDFFADQLESASKALGEYITEARPIVARLKELQAKATTFSNKISGDKHWKDDGDKIDENNDLIHDVNAAVSAFWAAERTCANKIRALYCAAPLVADDGSHGDNMYGYKGEDLNKAQDLPWGSQLEETHRAWEIGYWVKSFVWDGLIVDGIWGTIRGLGTLIGVDGWDKAGQAWTGLAKLATGLTLASIPGVGTAFWMLPDKDLPPWIRDSRTAVKETGKALVAWDEWGKNPARAAGAVTFNVLTTVFTGGAGTAAKAGTVAKVISVAGKAGRLIDPMTYIGKAGQLAKVKVGDLFANFGKVDGAFPKITDVVWKDLPKADMPGVKFPHPEDTVRLPDDALGRPQFYDKTTHQLLDHQGLPKQDLTSVPKGPDHPLAEVPKREDVTVGAPKHQEVTVGGPNHPTTHTPGGSTTHPVGGTADNLPHNSHTEPGGGTPGHGGTDTTPTGGGHGDTPSTGGHGDGPGGHGDGPGGHGDGPGDGPGGGDHTPGGGDHGGTGDGQPPGGDHTPSPDGGEPKPMVRGGEAEQRLRDAVKELPGKERPKPDVLERALERLAENPRGQQVADIIGSGAFKNSDNFSQVVSSMGARKVGMLEPALDQIIFADDLAKSGLKPDDIHFEVKKAEFEDTDVYYGPKDGESWGYQMKRLENPVDPVSEITRGKYLSQITHSTADNKLMLVDGQGTIAEWTARGAVDDLLEINKNGRGKWGAGKGVAFVIRLDDGVLVVPPGTRTDPMGMLKGSQ
ncbi:hypothetical protein [Streptomyces sp. NPDC029721]|uniref:hypothetical protein n=1 Tax=Streptomyces sp. NPDC029721 TaxID=3157090 RepID=UPI003410C13F